MGVRRVTRRAKEVFSRRRGDRMGCNFAALHMPLPGTKQRSGNVAFAPLVGANDIDLPCPTQRRVVHGFVKLPRLTGFGWPEQLADARLDYSGAWAFSPRPSLP